MKRRQALAGFSATVSLVALGSVAKAHGYKRGSVEAVHPWCPDSYIDGTKDVLVGMDIKNRGKVADKLLRAESKVASSVEIRDHSAVIVRSLSIPETATVTLGRKGAHIRLVALTKTLVAYDTLPVTLVFERAGRVKVDVLVEEPIEVKS